MRLACCSIDSQNHIQQIGDDGILFDVIAGMESLA